MSQYCIAVINKACYKLLSYHKKCEQTKVGDIKCLTLNMLPSYLFGIRTGLQSCLFIQHKLYLAL